MPALDQAPVRAPAVSAPQPALGFEPDIQDLLSNSALAAHIAAPAPQGADESHWLGSAIGGVVGGTLLGPLGALGGSWLGGEIEDAIRGPAPTQAPAQTPGQSQGQTPGQAQAQSTGLGQDVDALVARSPTLSANIAAARANGWTIRYSHEGETGTFADPSTKTIVINTSEAGNAPGIAQSLAHETGHALYTLDPQVGMEGRTRDEYVTQNTNRHLRDEGEATITNLIVRDELMRGDNPVDIGVAGAQSAQYIQLYEAWKAGGTNDRDALRRQIGDVFAHGEIPSTDGGGDYFDYYAQSYRDAWDAAHK